MDRLTAFVRTAHRRLRLRRILVAIERNPKLLEEDKMATPFLQGLTKAMDMLEHDLETGAKGLHIKIASVGDRGKAALTKGHQKMDAVAGRISEVEKFVTDLEGSNGGDPLDDSLDTSEVKPPAEPPAPALEQAKPEELTVNGVSKS
jgi:hypothetical protein